MATQQTNFNVSLNFYTNFNKCYAIKYDEVTQYLVHTLLKTTTSQNLAHFFQTPSEWISSLRVYPIDFSTFFASSYQEENVYVGTIAIQDVNNNTLKGYNLTQLSLLQTFSSYTKVVEAVITRRFNNFLDFNPYTRIELDLPFTEPIELNPIDVYNNTIKVYCIPDFNTGKGLYYIQNDTRILKTININLSVDIPLGSTNSSEMLRNQINNTLSLASGVSQGLISSTSKNPYGLAQAYSGVSGAFINGINNGIVKYTSKGSGSGVANMYNPIYSYFIIRYPEVKTITEYNHLYGKPLMEYKLLSQIHGYTEIEKIDLKYIPKATQNEINEIDSLLREGVILP